MNLKILSFETVGEVTRENHNLKPDQKIIRILKKGERRNNGRWEAEGRS